jgi:hypothetical protein
MRISGFTIVKDAARLGYPFEESIRSLLPVVDEIFVAVGRGRDDGETWDRATALRHADARVIPFLTEWPAPQGGGDVLAQQTNLALDRCTGDWAIYLQADEVLHEADHGVLRDALRDHLRRSTEGLLFEYLHFWRSSGLVSDDWANFYPRAVRAVKPGIGIISAGDAAGFLRRRHGRTRGLLKARTPARVFHYGWCNPPERQVQRINNLRAVYGERDPLDLDPGAVFGDGMAVRRFTGTHPRVMRARIASMVDHPAPARPWRWPAALRAAAKIARHPRSAAEWARPIFPVTLTNVYWRAIDAIEERRA